MMYVSDYVGCSSPLNFGKGDITFLEFQDLYKSISFLSQISAYVTINLEKYKEKLLT